MNDGEQVISDRLGQVLAKAISINVGQLRKGESVLPWTLFRLRDGGQYSLAAFGNPDFNQAKADARSRITGDAELIEAYVFGHGGQLETTEGEAVPALFYEIAERGQAMGLSYTLGYSLVDGEMLISQPNTGFMGEVDNWLALPTET